MGIVRSLYPLTVSIDNAIVWKLMFVSSLTTLYYINIILVKNIPYGIYPSIFYGSIIARLNWISDLSSTYQCSYHFWCTKMTPRKWSERYYHSRLVSRVCIRFKVWMGQKSPGPYSRDSLPLLEFVSSPPTPCHITTVRDLAREVQNDKIMDLFTLFSTAHVHRRF